MPTKGALIEYSDYTPLLLGFEFNPENITFSRSTSEPSKKSQSQKKDPDKTGSLGTVADDVTFSLEFLLDATDRMNDDTGLAAALGVQPQIDVIERMATLQSSKSQGVLKLLTVLKKTGQITHKKLPTLLFVWGTRIIPCRLTRCSINNEAFLPVLIPYRARVDLTLTVLEDHPLYAAEQVRQLAMIAAHHLDPGTHIANNI
ncbi:MAG: hypothetical protein MI799_14250 [Desulfobacterales bacterium]|nr:hypothetical protein [Desulfobacterales bacterium]